MKRFRLHRCSTWVLAFALGVASVLSGCNAGTIRFEDGADTTTGGGSAGGNPTIPPAPGTGASRGMWVWNSADVLESNDNVQALLRAATQIQVTDLYFFVEPTQYQTDAVQLRALIAQATDANMRVWALDGARVYFDDAMGPANLYLGVSNLVTFNQQAAANERFYGFQADDEPQDQNTYTSFHNGIADSELSQVAGSGVWQSTQAADREALMRDWLTIHTALQSTLHANGLRFGVAMPSWLSSYFNEEVRVNFPQDTSPRQGVMKAMMNLVDEYVVMSYNTEPSAAANLTLAPAQYASGFPENARPWVYAAVETTTGEGTGVSYADTQGKNTRTAVLNDMNAIEQTLSQNPAFHGVAIEQWSAWTVLKN